MASLAVAHKLPTIDFSEKNLKPGTNSWLTARKEVISALEEYGCFVALCDEISWELQNGFFSALKELFDLPIETKLRNKSSFKFHGYVGQIPAIPLYESMGIPNGDTVEGIQNFTKVMWPNGNHRGFCEKVFPYTKVAAEMEEVVARMVFEGYGLEKYYDSHLSSKGHVGRATKYREAEANEPNLGIPSHTDRSFLSTIYQNQVNGLEIKAKDGEWFTVDLTSPSAIVIMAGDAIMAWSSSRIKSPEHRVIVDGKEARYSFAQFSFIEGMVKAPEELVDDEHPLQFKPFDHLQYIYYSCKDENRRLQCPIRTYCGI